MKHIFVSTFIYFLVIAFSINPLMAQEKAQLDPVYNDPARLADMAKNIIKRGKKEVTPDTIDYELHKIANSQYTSGIAKAEHYEYFECKVKELKKIEQIRSSIKEKGKKNCYQNIVNQFTKDCVQNWSLGHFYAEIDPEAQKFEDKYECEGIHVSADFEGDKEIDRVRSLYHTLYTKTLEGFFEKVKADPKLKAAEYEVATHKQCLEGLVKRIYLKYEPEYQCMNEQQKCSTHSECCSGVCMKADFESKGKCSAVLSCYTLLKEGQQCGRLADGHVNSYCDTEKGQGSCLEVDYNTSNIGECTENGRKPSADKPCCSDKKNSKGLCTRQLICTTCVKAGKKPKKKQSCCEGYYKDETGTCVQDFPPFGPVTSINKLKKNSKFFISFLKTILSNLSFNAYAQDGCIPGVTCAQEGLTNDELGQGSECMEKNEDGSMPTDEEIETCLKETRNVRFERANEKLEDEASDKQMSKTDYQAGAVAGQVNVDEESDFQKCHFNTFEDLFKAQSSAARNADMVMRGFEFIYSGDGTKDYWINNSGLSIFERAKAIAMKYRRIRSENFAKYKKNDKELKCLCLATMGIAKFPDQQQFFQSSCPDHAAQVNPESGEMGNPVGNAVGEEYEKMVMDYLSLRMEVQLDTFNFYQDLEEELAELSTFVKELKWEKAWDRQDYLYDFTAKKYSDESKDFMRLTMPIVAEFIIDAIEDKEEELEEALAEKETISVFPEKTGGRMVSVVEKDWHGPVDFDNYHKDYQRYYVGPYYKTSESEDLELDSGVTLDNQKNCEVYSSSRSCIRNIHRVSFEEETRYLLDAKFPEFINESAYNRNTLLITKINTAHDTGVAYLKAFKPENTLSDTHNRVEEVDDLDSLTPDPQTVANMFTPGGPGWEPAEFEGETAFKSALKKYAKCKKLKDCGAKFLENEEGIEYIGFGYLFENDQDINEFADYVFQQHFLWPSLAAYKEMSYPTMASSAYFETLAYMVAVLKSSSANKGIELGEAYDKYESDYTTRENEYELTGGVKNEKQKIENAKYSSEFRANFKKLNLSVGASATELFGADGKLNMDTSGLNSNELQTIQNAAQNAIARSNKQKKKEHYMKVVGNTPRGKAKMKAKEQFMSKFARPLDRISLKRNGKQYGKLGDSSDSKVASKRPKKKLAVFRSKKRKKLKKLKKIKARKKKRIKEVAHKVKNSKLTQTELRNAELLFNSVKENKKLFKRGDADSLFQIVTKAYKRNLFRIFKTRNQVSTTEGSRLEFDKSKHLKNSKKEELKNLLGD